MERPSQENSGNDAKSQSHSERLVRISTHETVSGLRALHGPGPDLCRTGLEQSLAIFNNRPEIVHDFLQINTLSVFSLVRHTP